MNVTKKDKKPKMSVGSREQKSACEKKKKPSCEATAGEVLSKDRGKKKTVRNRKGKEKDPPKGSQRRKTSVSRESKMVSIESPTNLTSAETAEVSSAPTMRTPSDEPSTDKNKPSPSNKEVIKPSEKERVGNVEKKKSQSQQSKPKAKDSAESTEGRKFNLMLAKMFFQQMMEQRRTSKTPISNDEMLETMPAHNQMPISAKAVKKHREHHRKSAVPLNRAIFKPNGEPVWLIPERKANDLVEIEDGVKTRYPELMLALAEDKIKMEDGKQWLAMIGDFADGKFDAGILDELPEFNPFLPFDELAERTDLYYRMITVQYYTMRNLCVLCKVALDRFETVFEMSTADKRRMKEEEDNRGVAKPEEMEKTAVVTSISFNMAKTFSISYDRRRPILSIQKLRNKFQAKLRVSNEATANGGSREGSRERT